MPRSFIIAFHNPRDAALFAVEAQAALLECNWPEELYELEVGAAAGGQPLLPTHEPPSLVLLIVNIKSTVRTRQWSG
jgi:hypothetical protein